MSVLSFDELSVELTHKCILDCIFCSSNASPQKDIELEFSRLIEIIDECLQKFKIKTVSLSGGEPLLYSHRFELIEEILKRRLELVIYTSGLIWDSNKKIASWDNSIIERFQTIQRKFYTKIRFFFDIQSAKQKTYEKITRISGSFEKLLETLMKIRNIDFSKSVHIVPFKKNWKELENTIKFCFDQGFESIKILRFVPQGRASNFSTLQLNLDEFYLLQQDLRQLTNKYKGRVTVGHPIDFLFLLDPQVEPRSCRGGNDGPIILPSGDVHLCPAWKSFKELVIGNIYESSFENIWHSEILRSIRAFLSTGYKELTGICEGCNYLSMCKGKCIAQRLLNQDLRAGLNRCLLLGPDPLCLKQICEKRGWE